MATTATPHCGVLSSKLYLQSGQFTSTIKTSISVVGVDAFPEGLDWDGTNTPWTGNQAGKMYLTSGQFTSTIKTSQSVSSDRRGISWDGTNTPYTGRSKIYIHSGQFTSTIKDSTATTSAADVSASDANIPYSEDSDKLVLLSGIVTSTVKDSVSITAIDTDPRGCSWDGTNTPWAGSQANKLYLQSGQFTSTLKTSYATGIFPGGISTDDVNSRLGLPTSIYMNGRMARFALGKPTDVSAQASDFVTDTYNTGNGVIYSALTADQKTDWGVSVWYNLMEASGTGTDSHASKTLTDNNTVTVADGPAVATPPDAEADGNPITEWGSKEGDAYKELQSTAAKRPVMRLTSNGINSEPVIELDGTAALLTMTSLPITATEDTVSCVIKTGTSVVGGGDQVFFSSSDEGGTTDSIEFGHDNSGKLYVEHDSAGANRVTGDTVLSNSTVYLVTISTNGSAWTITLDGEDESLTVTTGLNTGDWFNDLIDPENTAIGGFKSTTEESQFEGKIAEIVAYPNTYQDDIENYLTSRYGVS